MDLVPLLLFLGIIAVFTTVFGGAFLLLRLIYPLQDADFRIWEFNTILRYLPLALASLLSTGFFLLMAADWAQEEDPDWSLVYFALGFAGLGSLPLVLCALRSAAWHIGMLIDEEQGTFSMPLDMIAHTFSRDFFRFYFLWGWGRREILPLSDIEGFTRSAHGRMVIAGRFGKRRLCWYRAATCDRCIRLLGQAAGLAGRGTFRGQR